MRLVRSGVDLAAYGLPGRGVVPPCGCGAPRWLGTGTPWQGEGYRRDSPQGRSMAHGRCPGWHRLSSDHVYMARCREISGGH